MGFKGTLGFLERSPKSKDQCRECKGCVLWRGEMKEEWERVSRDLSRCNKTGLSYLLQNMYGYLKGCPVGTNIGLCTASEYAYFCQGYPEYAPLYGSEYRALRELISVSLGRHFYVHSWLLEKGISKELLTPTNLKEYRLRWIQELHAQYVGTELPLPITSYRGVKHSGRVS